MAFVDFVKEFLKDNPADVWDIPDELDCVFVQSEIHDETRWTTVKHTVFERKDEFVLVEHHEGATEMQEDVWESYPPDVFAVEPYQVTVTKYRPV